MTLRSLVQTDLELDEPFGRHVQNALDPPPPAILDNLRAHFTAPDQNVTAANKNF